MALANAPWRAAKPACDGLSENDVRAALAALDPLWATLFPAEQARIVQLLIDRVDIGTEGLRLSFRDKGLAQMVAEISIMTGKGRRQAA
jgi:site-specific DNA recombinase